MQVRFVTNGTKSQGSTLTNSETGELLHGVRRIVATAQVDDIVTVEAEFVSAAVEAEGRLVAQFVDPASGEVKAVKRIEFVDGSKWTA